MDSKIAFVFFLLASIYSAEAMIGSATYYWNNGTASACGQTFNNNHFVAAVNPEAWIFTGICGRRARITYGSNSVEVRIEDKCPVRSCTADDIDLSVAAFQALANLSAGHITVSWQLL